MGWQALFPSSAAYDASNLKHAANHASTVEADLGGTEILKPLQWVLEQPSLGHDRHIFVLTDGAVSNPSAVFDLAKSHCSDTTVHTLGIGAGASIQLVEGLAEAGGGTVEFAAGSEVSC